MGPVAETPPSLIPFEPVARLWSTGISSVSERGGGEPALQWKEGVEGEGAFRYRTVGPSRDEVDRPSDRVAGPPGARAGSPS